MKRLPTLLTLIALFTLAQAPLQAQTNAPPPPSLHTNLLLNVSISLTVYSQNVTPVQTNLAIQTASKSTASTRDIINSIGSDLGQGTNHSAGAKLLWRIGDVGTTNQTFSFILRNGTNDTDLTSRLFFLGSSLAFDQSATTERFSSKNSTTNSTSYFIERLNLRSTQATFDGLGMFTLVSSSLVKNHHVISSAAVPVAFRMAFAGSGSIGRQPAVIRGQITAAGRKLEVVSR